MSEFPLRLSVNLNRTVHGKARHTCCSQQFPAKEFFSRTQGRTPEMKGPPVETRKTQRLFLPQSSLSAPQSSRKRARIEEGKKEQRNHQHTEKARECVKKKWGSPKGSTNDSQFTIVKRSLRASISRCGAWHLRSHNRHESEFRCETQGAPDSQHAGR